MRPLRLHSALPVVFAMLLALPPGSRAQELQVVKPSSTGIPGELMLSAAWAPDGRLWASARWPFWGEGGVGIWDPVSESWTVLSNWETPLPSQYVYEIAFEADGTAWMATGGGLVRYEPGSGSWEVWDSSNSPLALDGVGDVSLAPDGHVWLNNSSSSSGGDAVWEFDGVATWVKYAVGNELPWAPPWTDLEEVFVDSTGTVWVTNETLNGVARFDGAGWTLHGEGVDRFADMTEDAFGNLWLMSNPVGGADRYYRYDGTSFTAFPFGEPTVLTSDPDTGTVYFGNWYGQVSRTSDGGATIEPYLSGLNIVFDIAPRATGDVWVATIGALGEFSPEGQILSDWNSYNTGFPDYFVDDFFTDDDGYFWITTGEAGLTRFDGLRYRNFGNHNLGAEPYPFAGNEPMGAVFQDSQGTHWFGGNGISRWDSGSNQATGFWNWQNNPGMGVTMFRDFAEDDAGRLFAVSEYGSILCFEEPSNLWVPTGVVVYSPLSDFPGMLTDADGDVWVVGWFDIWRWDGATWAKVAQPDADLLFDLGGVNDFDIGPDGTFWLGTAGGLVRWDAGGYTVFDPTNSPLPGPFVSGVDVRADGLLAVAARGSGSSTPSGVCLVDGDPTVAADWDVTLYGASELPHWQLGDAHFDAQGDLWVSAISEGVVRFATGAWNDLGEPLAGTHGTPHLLGSGLPIEGQTVQVAFSRAVEGAPAYLVLGFDTADVWFFGGTLVPFPTAVLPPVGSGPHGQFTGGGAWPAGLPSGTSLYAQWWIADAGAPLGFAATNAVSVTVP